MGVFIFCKKIIMLVLSFICSGTCTACELVKNQFVFGLQT